MRNAQLLGALVVSLIATSGRPTFGSPTTPVWPTASELPRAEAKSTVLAFVRGDDPQAAAKLAELSSIVEHLRTRPFVAVVQVGAPIQHARWNATTARLVDADGSEARRFGATGGRVVVYDANGALQYSGAAAGLRLALR
jgi:hypothetical protein